jgi:hypothetical protein
LIVKSLVYFYIAGTITGCMMISITITTAAGKLERPANPHLQGLQSLGLEHDTEAASSSKTSVTTYPMHKPLYYRGLHSSSTLF